MRKKKLDLQKLICNFVFFVLVVSFVFLLIRIVIAPSEQLPEDPNGRLRSDYVLMMLQCLLGIIAMMLPDMLKKRIHLSIPSGMMILYAIFLYCAIFLGEVRSYYYQVPHWDTILHTFSGGMLGALGYSFVTILNKSDRIPMNLSPLFVAVFSFCFALSLGVFWEFYEYTFDGILGLNMQKFMLEDGTQLVGRAALSDTMKDLIVDSLGAFVMSLAGYISLKYKTGWIEGLMLKTGWHHEKEDKKAPSIKKEREN